MKFLATSGGIFGISTLALLLGGCTQLDSKGRNMQAGPDKFTFAGDLPADFGIGVDVGYVAIEPKNCQVFDLSQGKEITRRYGKGWAAPISSQAQKFSFDIPLTYKEGICERKLGSVNLKIRAKYGELGWQRTYANGGFIITNKLPGESPEFNADGELKVKGEYSWLFQTSNAKSRIGEIEKILQCKGAGAYLQRDQLADKTVRLTVALYPEERPAVKDTWIKFSLGLKLCSGDGPNDKFRFSDSSPGIFTEFRMNGKTCTTYPGCTEGTDS